LPTAGALMRSERTAYFASVRLIKI